MTRSLQPKDDAGTPSVTPAAAAGPGPAARQPQDAPAGDPGPGADALPARVLREILRTPAFRQVARLLAAPAGERPATDLLTTLLREDPEVWMALAAGGPGRVNDAVASLLALGKHLGGMPEGLLQAYLDALSAALDRAALTELPATWAPLLARVAPRLVGPGLEALAAGLQALAQNLPGPEEWEERLEPQALAQALDAAADLLIRIHEARAGASGESPAALQGLVAETLARADLGRLRRAAAAAIEASADLARAAIYPALDDPVAVANAVSALPPAVNALLGLARDVLARLDLPDEVLASGVFNTLEALDAKALAELCNAAARQIALLHRGNLTLGGAEPAFGPVLADRLDALLEHLDLPALLQAAAALGEDFGVAAEVLARRVATDPALTAALAKGLTRAAAHGLAAGLAAARELRHLPPESRAALREALAEIPPEARAEAFGLLLDAAEAMLAPGPTGTTGAAALWQELPDAERARASRLLGRAALPLLGGLAEAVLAELRAEPAQVGRGLNRVLAGLDRWLSEEPDRWRDLARRAFEPVDRELLGRVAHRVRDRIRTRLARRGRDLTPPWLSRGAREIGRVAHRGRSALRRARFRAEAGSAEEGSP